MNLFTVRISRVMATMAVALAVIALVLSSSSAMAGKGWCRSDPRISIGGHLLDIDVQAYSEAAPDGIYQFAPVVHIRVHVDTGVTGSVVSIDDNAFGGGYDIQFVTDSSMRQYNGHEGYLVEVWTDPVTDPLTGSAYTMRVYTTPVHTGAGLDQELALFRSNGNAATPRGYA